MPNGKPFSGTRPEELRTPSNDCRIVVIDDSELQCSMWRMYIEKRFGESVHVETYWDPREGVRHLSPDINLLLLDWDMPDLDGEAVLEMARQRGVDLKRIVITSSHPADRLHEVFDSSGCLAVIEKEPQQLKVCAMIVKEILRRAGLVVDAAAVNPPPSRAVR